MYEDYTVIPKDMAQLAICAQTACNLSGLAHNLPPIVARLWKQAREEGRGTDWVNRHPVVLLFVTQMAHLSRYEEPGRWEAAHALCESAATRGKSHGSN
jgi:hypothetical protein